MFMFFIESRVQWELCVKQKADWEQRVIHCVISSKYS